MACLLDDTVRRVTFRGRFGIHFCHNSFVMLTLKSLYLNGHLTFMLLRFHGIASFVFCILRGRCPCFFSYSLWIGILIGTTTLFAYSNLCVIVASMTFHSRMMYASNGTCQLSLFFTVLLVPRRSHYALSCIRREIWLYDCRLKFSSLWNSSLCIYLLIVYYFWTQRAYCLVTLVLFSRIRTVFTVCISESWLYSLVETCVT